jgi:uncharacterized protein YjbJ (UPF0337 family)
MNTNQLKGNWHQLKGQAKIQWGKLTDNELTEIEGNYEKLCGKLQEKYGYSQEQASKEVNQFYDSHK